MPISIGICIWNGGVRTPNRRYTVSRVRTRGRVGCVMDYKDIACRGGGGGRVAMYGARVGVDVAQTVGKDDRKLG